MNNIDIGSIDAYIASFPDEIQVRLNTVRETIEAVAKDATPCISYAMPAYKLNGMLVYFADYKNHIGFYPTGRGIEAFKDELSDFKFAKGSIQFSHDNPLPIDLIKRIVKFRVEENLNKKPKK
jgi:uncharacterized protein YdhG (YjbR/CyaY superfamily)